MKHDVVMKIHADPPNSYLGDIEPGAGRGMHFITNKWCVSAQAGWGNYCSNDPSRTGEKLSKSTIRTDCEVGYWSTDGDRDLISLGNDSVEGWVPWSAVLDMWNGSATRNRRQVRTVSARSTRTHGTLQGAWR